MQSFIGVRVESEVGLVRGHNEDNVWAGDGMLVVADGMGGHEAGEVASRLAVEVFAANAPRVRTAAEHKSVLLDLLEELFQLASDTIEAEGAGNGMGTTLVCAILAPDDTTVYIAHVGDSRAYVLREGVLSQITTDHNVLNLLLARGKPRERAAAHPAAAKLTQALGLGLVTPDVAEVRLAPGDQLLLCTDGLTDVVDDPSIQDAMQGKGDVAQALVDAAYQAGAPDNVSLVVAQVPTPHSGMTVRADHAHLKALELFEDLDESQLASVAPFLDEQQWRDGEIVVTEGEEGDACIILTRGQVDITKGGVVLNTIGAGSALGEMALAGPWTRSATITAVGLVHAFILTREAYEELCRFRPRIGIVLANALTRIAARRLRRLTNRIDLVVQAAEGAFDQV